VPDNIIRNIEKSMFSRVGFLGGKDSDTRREKIREGTESSKERHAGGVGS